MRTSYNNWTGASGELALHAWGVLSSEGHLLVTMVSPPLFSSYISPRRFRIRHSSLPFFFTSC